MLKTLGRLLIASVFICGGASTFAHPEIRAKEVAKMGLSEEQAKQATIFNALVMLIAGTALAMGFAPRFAAAVLTGSLLPTTLIGHAFFQERELQDGLRYALLNKHGH